MTKTVLDRPIAQGDILIIPIASIPADAKAAVAVDGKFIIAHSESGHNHVINRPRAEVYEAADDEFIAYIKTLCSGAEIVHERPFDTHETIALPPNRAFQVRRQREYIPEGFRKAAD